MLKESSLTHVSFTLDASGFGTGFTCLVVIGDCPFGTNLKLMPQLKLDLVGSRNYTKMMDVKEPPFCIGFIWI